MNIQLLQRLKVHALCAAALFVVFYAIYYSAVPASFNSKYENRKYFDSDGEFITRQFRQEKTYTHNDHLLYHILARFIFDNSEKFGIEPNYITPHKILSAFFGALGVVFFYIFGVLLTKKTILPLLCAIFAGGTAGWLFFSTTVDTYVPCLSVSIPVIGLTAMSMDKQTLLRSALIGVFAGLAFLFRTDSILLALMAVYLIRNKKEAGNHLLAIVVPGFIVGIVGYAMLSHWCYDVDLVPETMWKWLRGSLNRPEAQGEKIWGVAKNLTIPNAALMLVNQLLYTIMIPGMMKTRGADFYLRYVKGGWIPLLIYLAAIGIAIYYLIKRIRENEKHNDFSTPLYISIVIGIWFFSRLLFYTWWDPYDPFLFALMAMPAVWMTLLMGFNYAFERKLPRKTQIINWSLLGAVTLTVWLHNIYYMIAPLRGN